MNLKKIEFKIINKKNILFLFVFLFTVIKIYIAIQNASVGVKLSELEKQENRLLADNREKQSQIVEESSLLILEKRAQDLGFLKKPQKLYINVDEASLSSLR